MQRKLKKLRKDLNINISLSHHAYFLIFHKKFVFRSIYNYNLGGETFDEISTEFLKQILTKMRFFVIFAFQFFFQKKNINN